MFVRTVTMFVCGLAMTAAPLALQPRADAPAVDLTNGILKAKMYVPDVARGFYRSTRFEWGVLASLEFKGHSFYGPWFTKHDPTVGNFEFRDGAVVVGDHNWISGPVEEFSVPLGYDEAPAGGTFVKIGVGQLRKPATARLTGSRTSTTSSMPARGRSKTTAISAEITHTVKDSGGGYGYDYTKVTRLVPGAAQMVIEHRLRNTGAKPIDSSTYNHNFMVMDGRPTGPGLVFIAPFALTTARPPDPAFAEISGNRFVYKKELQVGDQVSTRLQGFGPSAADYDFRIENARSGTGVRIRGDRPLSNMVLWSIRPTFAIEPFVAIAVKPGEQFAWTYTYDYYELAQ